jgi:glycosyltransferase involved in cell wall biosynthesis
MGIDPLISAAIITRDEETLIEQCIGSIVDFVDEIVVYDTGSSDRTVELARAAGAVVVEGEWHDDFARARNAALDACRGRWILSVDADEWLLEPGRAATTARRRLLELPDDVLRVSIPVISRVGTRATAMLPASGPRVVRVFRRDKLRWKGRVHEIPEPIGADLGKHRVWQDVRLVHDGYLADIWAERGKAERNLRLVLADEPEGSKGWFERARALANVGRVDEALDAYDRTRCATDIVETGFAAAAIRLSGYLELERGNLDAARRAARELRSAANRSGVADVFEAQVALADGRPERAVELLDGVTDYDDNYAVTTPADVSTWLAVALVQSGDLERGAAEAARAIGLQADLPEAWLAIAVAHTSGYTEATELAARTVDPDHLLAALGRVLALPDPAVDVVCEALWQHFGGLAVLRAVAERLSSRLGGSRGDVWAARAGRHPTPAAK